MRNLNYAFLVTFIAAVAGCKKPATVGDNGCISRVYSPTLINVDTVGAIKLFNDNGLSTAHLIFYRVILNDVITNPSGTYNYQHVFAMQRYNGLQVFNNSVAFQFINRVFNYQDGSIYGAVNISTTPRLTLPQVRALFINVAAQNNFANLRDSCLVAMLGYYNLNGGSSNPAPNLVKAWFVTPKNAPYPSAYINDDNNATIAFFNGTVTFGAVN